MSSQRNIAMHDYQESVTTGQTDAEQSDPYLPLCFKGHATRMGHLNGTNIARGN